MYNDYTEYENNRFPVRTVLVKMVIIILIIMLLIWLLPSSLFDGEKRQMEQNATKFKEASLKYYKSDNLPSKTDEELKISLKQLQDSKLIGQLKSKNKKTCDIDKSYSILRKREKDYLLTTYLECGDNKLNKDYIVNNYNYCETSLCEKQIKKETASNPTCILEVTKGELGVYDWYRSNVEVTLKEKNAKSGLKIKEFGIGLKKDYNSKDTYLIKKDGTYKIYGYIKDTNNKEGTCSITINKDAKKPTCELSVIKGSKNNKGLYYGDVEVGFKSKKDELSGLDIYGISDTKEALFNEEDKVSVDTNGKTTIYGHVKDKAGNTNTCSITINKTNSSSNNNKTLVNNSNNTTNNTNIINKSTKSINKEKGLSCDLTVHSGIKNKNNIYVSDVVIKFKNITTNGTSVTGYGIGKNTTYSKNSTYKITTNGTHMVYGYVKDNKGNTTKCKISIKRNVTNNTKKTYKYAKYIPAKYSSWSSWKEDTYNISNPPKFYKSDTREVENLGKNKVSTYKYSAGSAIYLSKINEVKTLTEMGCPGYTYYRLGSTTYAVKNTSWIYTGKVTINSTPSESIGVKYEFDSLNWNCGNCTTPNIVWKKYTRNTVNANSLSCSTKQNIKITVTNQYRQIVGFNQTRSLVNNIVYKYRYRTRNLLKAGYTDYKYSNSKNDASLIKQGYKLV